MIGIDRMLKAVTKPKASNETIESDSIRIHLTETSVRFKKTGDPSCSTFETVFRVPTLVGLLSALTKPRVAIAAWPGEIPPSFAGTRLCVKTSKPSLRQQLYDRSQQKHVLKDTAR